jgi:hypothetical protein
MLYKLITFFSLTFFVFFLSLNTVNAQTEAPTATPTSPEIIATTNNNEPKQTKVYIATVVDASEINDFSKENEANRQTVTLEIEVQTTSGEKRLDRVETIFDFPNNQFKKPLKIGDQVLIESATELNPAQISFISYYRQNNLLIWAIILFGLFLTVSGFKNNVKYIQILFIFIVSSSIVLLLYRQNTYITFGLLFAWQILATFLFAYRIFARKIPSLILTLSVFGNQLLAMILTFVMNNINIFDIGLFDIFFPTVNDAREVMMYIFSVLVIYPITVIFAEQVLNESIKKKREEANITKIELVKFLTKSNLRALNQIYLTFFGVFAAVFICVLALASTESIFILAVNSSTLSQFISLGFLILFSILVFIPLISSVTGILLGRVETHELVTDRNLKQLEL